MKKAFEIILGITLVFCLVACGEKEAISDKNISDSQPTSSSEQADQKVTDEKQKTDSESGIYSIKINGEEYTFPMSYEKFKSYGWTYYEPEKDDVSKWATTVRPNTSYDVDYDNGEIKWLDFLFYNDTAEEVTLDKCQVIGFGLEYDRTILGKTGREYINIPKGSIVLNDELSIGESGKEVLSGPLATALGAGSDIGLISTDDLIMTFEFDENGIFSEMTYTDMTLMK